MFEPEFLNVGLERMNTQNSIIWFWRKQTFQRISFMMMS